MSAGLLVIGVAVLACGAAGLLLLGASSRDVPTGGPMLLAAAATLLLAAATATFAWRAARRARDLAADLERLARSVDAAMAELTARSDRDRAALAALHGLVSRGLGPVPRRAAPASVETPQLPSAGSVAPKPPAANAPQKLPADDVPKMAPAHDVPQKAPHESAPQAPPAGTVAQAPSSGVLQPPTEGGPPPEQSAPEPWEPGIEAALHRIMKAGRAEISLEPIISVARGAARGYEVHVYVAAAEGEIHLRRPRQDVRGHDAAAFERLVAISAADAARRRLVPASEARPLHVPISDALLGNDRELARLFDLLRTQDGLARSVILSLPSTVAAGGQQPALRRLAAAGVRFALEGWDGSGTEFEALQRFGLRFLKLPADRLLDRAKPDGAAPAVTLLDRAAEAGVEIVATGVSSDEDAVALLDLGIDLMAGPRFSAPRRLARDTGQSRATVRDR